MNWSIRRFPQQGALRYTLTFVAVAFLAGMVYRLALSPLNRKSFLAVSSVWQHVLPVMWVVAFGTGLSLIGFYLRLHVAHGQTRRDFMSRATGYLVVSTAVLAAGTATGIVLEAAIYRISGWDYFMGYPEYEIRSALDFAVVFARLGLQFGAMAVAGMLVTAGFRRFTVAGLLLTSPLAVAMIVLTIEAASDGGIFGVSVLWHQIALWSSVPIVLLGLAASWVLTRKVAV